MVRLAQDTVLVYWVRSIERKREHEAGVMLASMGAVQIIGRSPEIRIDESGKPFFENTKLFFNISHSGGMVVCAFSWYPVGIDVELSRRDMRKIAERYYRPEETEWLKRNGFSQEDACTLWSYKESLLKRRGTGLSDIGKLEPLIRDGRLVTKSAEARFFEEDVLPECKVVICTDPAVEKAVYIEAELPRDFLQNK